MFDIELIEIFCFDFMSFGGKFLFFLDLQRRQFKSTRRKKSNENDGNALLKLKMKMKFFTHFDQCSLKNSILTKVQKFIGEFEAWEKLFVSSISEIFFQSK